MRLALLLCLAGSLLLLAHEPQRAQPAPSMDAATARAYQRKLAHKAAGTPEVEWTNRVAVQVAEGADPADIARRHGGELRFVIKELPGWCEIAFADVQAARAAEIALRADAGVRAAIHQQLRRAARKTNDPLFANQWHLMNTVNLGRDLAAEAAWALGATGNGVNVMIVDDGVDHQHADLAAGYNAARSYDFVDTDPDPAPNVGLGDDHGTACAGLAVARANNSGGVAGVAYDATWSAARLLGANQTDSTEAGAVARALADIDVYSNSWGTPDTGEYGPVGPLTRAAIENGVATGRGGLGAIYVWAAGNGFSDDDSNVDGYPAMTETIAVASINRQGTNSSYSEVGANILTTAPGGEGDVYTTDISGAGGYNSGSPFLHADYTSDFDGTSAATPMVSGVVALMLQANPALTWRDVQHILVYASDHNRVGGLPVTNGARLRVKDRFGFGAVQSDRAVKLAQNWLNVGARQMVATALDAAGVAIPDGNQIGVTRTVNVPGNLVLEHVVLEINSNHTWWGDFDILLTAPSGTTSQMTISTGGPGTPGTWQYKSVRHWGEDTQGTWTMRIRDLLAQDTGTLQSWRLMFFGTSAQTMQTTTVTNTTLANATQFAHYTHTFLLDFGFANADWSVAGALPAGLALLNNGALTGTPSQAGTYNFTVQADSYSPPAFASASVTLIVDPGTAPPPVSTGGGGGGGGGCSVTGGAPWHTLALAACGLVAWLRRRRVRP